MRMKPKTRRRRSAFRRALFLGFLMIPCARLAAQKPGPLTPAPPHEVRRIGNENKPEPPPVPLEQIIQAFVAKQDEFLRAHQAFSFKRSIRFEEFPADGEAGGELFQESDVFLATNGKRYERVTNRRSLRLRTTKLEADDLQTLAQVPFFPLPSDQLQFYDLTYHGTQPLDELHTYVFQVKPKKLLPRMRLFDGLLYVDDRDLAVVKIYGRWAALEEEAEENTRHLPFSVFEIYCENVDGKYWFPNFIRAEEFVRAKGGENRLRLTVKMADFKTAAAVPPPDGAPALPGPAAPSSAPPKPPSHPPS
jgi:hypothetical protein